MMYNLNGDMCHPRGSDIFLYSSTAVSKMHRLLFVDYCMPHWRRCIIGPCPRFDLGQLLIQQAVYIFRILLYTVLPSRSYPGGRT